MNGLIIKDIQFNGSTLRAAQDMNKIIWIGVRWVCNGLGLSEGQMKSERKKIQADMVLSQGTKFHPLGMDDANSDVLCLKLDFLPLWLAKIRITPTIKKRKSGLSGKTGGLSVESKGCVGRSFLEQRNIRTNITDCSYGRF